MWQKIKCWLGLHEFEPMCDYCQRESRKNGHATWCSVTGVRCNGHKFRCKHCGKVKK